MFVKQAAGRTPVVAWDDTPAEVDVKRRKRELGAVTKHEQVALTATERAILPYNFLENADIYTVMNGRVTQDSIANANP